MTKGGRSVLLVWRIKRAVLWLRGMVFTGRRYQCPVCQWQLRSFTGRRGLLTRSKDGYCPRCNAKARHRRHWLYLQQHSDLFHKPQTLLEVAPWWSLATRFRSLPHIRYLGLDLVAAGPHVNLVGDVVACPLPDNSVDTLLCIHVLEHVADDRRAMAELHRVLKPGGTAIISVPLRFSQRTIEDPGITDPEERKRLFGERGHVRWYGPDIVERLEAAGFEVSLHRGTRLDARERARFGLRTDENILHCRKPRSAALAA
jgi:SAM-dependent methyltransferase